MFENFFTLFKILSVETSPLGCELYRFVTTFKNWKPNWFQKEKSDLNFLTSGKMFEGAEKTWTNSLEPNYHCGACIVLIETILY